ncbi:hypothetical protein AQ477_23045 [Burkholderia thailandensis]|nr:hypothetical protein AQ477_23045 [Burkholderia thailandensis]KXF58548.1 hypothetical protein AQ476_28180 [Burkholderia thailandensis]
MHIPAEPASGAASRMGGARIAHRASRIAHRISHIAYRISHIAYRISHIAHRTPLPAHARRAASGWLRERPRLLAWPFAECRVALDDSRRRGARPPAATYPRMRSRAGARGAYLARPPRMSNLWNRTLRFAS